MRAELPPEREMPQVRAQQDTDIEAINAINAAAFADHGGTAAFDRMRAERTDILSLVATTEEAGVIGHVLFSPVILDGHARPIDGMGLGQLAVHPDYQKQGVGTLLTETGLAALRVRQCPFVIVVGHATYYPRFGFRPGAAHNFICQWEGIPDNNFMVLIFDPQQSASLSGVARFVGL